MKTSSVAWLCNDVDAVTTPDGTDLSHRHHHARLFVRNGRLVAGKGYHAASRQARRDLARVGAIVILRARGRYLVHASGVVDPHGRAWLLSGNSGAGKSTLAYALSRAGWNVLGDDGVVIEVRGDDVVAYPWRDPLQVSHALASQFPELHEHADRVRTSDWRERIPMHAPVAHTARVSALMLLQRADERSVSRLGPLEALAALVRQSPLVMIDDGHARAHLDALRRAVALPCFLLRHTPAELHGVAPLLEGVLAA